MKTTEAVEGAPAGLSADHSDRHIVTPPDNECDG
jgi:hypothetical protein